MINVGDLIVHVKPKISWAAIRPNPSHTVWTRNGPKQIEPDQVGIVLYVNQQNGNLKVLIDGEVCQSSLKRWKLPDDWALLQWEDRVKATVERKW